MSVSSCQFPVPRALSATSSNATFELETGNWKLTASMAPVFGLFRRVLPAAVRGRARRAMFEWLQLTWTTSSGIGLRVATYNEWIIYNEVFVDGEYDAAIDAALTARGDRALHVLDLGANVGFFTLRLFDRLRAAGITDASCAATLVEANPDLIPVLRARLLGGNALAPAVRIVPGLAGEPSGSATLFRSPDALGDSSVLRPTADAVSVPFVDLTPLMSDAPVIDLLKCDIEGSELAVLEHYPDLLQRTRIAVIEHHHDLCPVERCHQLLRAAGLVHETDLRDRGGHSLRINGGARQVPRFRWFVNP